MNPTPELLDAIDRDRIEAARRMPIEEKLWAGAHLFDEVCERMKAGIRMQFPDADEGRVSAILRDRFRRIREIEEREYFRPVEPDDDE